MSLIQRFQMWRLGKKDGRADNYQAENRIKAEIGEKEPWDPEEFEDQSFTEDDLQAEDKLQEFEQLTPEEEARARIPVPAPVLVVGVVVFSTIGTMASIQLTGLMGWTTSHRLLLGFGLESLVVLLTAGVHSVFRGQIKNRGAQFFIIVLYAAFLISTAAFRLNDVSVPDEGLRFIDFFAAILLVFATAGPSWLLEICLRLLIEEALLRRLQKLNSRHLRQDRHKSQRSRRTLANAGRKRRQYDLNYARLKAIYKSRFSQFEPSKNGKEGNK